MLCESWKAKLDTYLDGELPEEEMRALDAHVRTCSSCAMDILTRVQTKRAIQAAGKRFVPSTDFRRRIKQSVAAKRQRGFQWVWMFAAAAVALIAGALSLSYVSARSGREHLLSEVADLHVMTLASSSPVDVISTDRHTVKPWFQGKIPFAFDLPELQNTGFTLVGGRLTYLEQTPGAHLIYDVRKHHISVFIFPEDALRDKFGEKSASPDSLSRSLPFNTEVWRQRGLLYFVIGDASAADIDSLARLFKAE